MRVLRPLPVPNVSFDSSPEFSSPVHVTMKCGVDQISVQTLSPIPQPGPSKRKTYKRKQKSVILTTTPNKDELLEAQKAKSKTIKTKSRMGTKKRIGVKSKLFTER